MVAASPPQKSLTTGDIERLTGAPKWLVRAIIDRGDVVVAGRVGLYRTVTLDQLPAVLADLEKRGYPARPQEAVLT